MIYREFARRLGITTLELNKRLNEDPSLDHEIDGTVTKLSEERKDDKLIFDSRMAWHFAKDTFKIFLTIDPMEAARRAMLNQRGAEEHYESVEEACEKLRDKYGEDCVVMYAEVGPLIGIHLGKGAFAIVCRVCED